MVEEFEITIDSLWVDYPSYLQSRTDGQGTTCRGAFDDALECLAQADDSLAKYVQGMINLEVEEIYQAFLNDGDKARRKAAIEAMEKEIDSVYDTDEGRDDCAELPYIYCALSIRDSKGKRVDR